MTSNSLTGNLLMDEHKKWEENTLKIFHENNKTNTHAHKQQANQVPRFFSTQQKSYLLKHLRLNRTLCFFRFNTIHY